MVAYQLTEEVVKTTYEHEKFLTEVIGDASNTKSKNIAIIGEPGAGKSTLLEEIGKYLIKHDGLPIYIPLSNLSGDTLKEYLLKRWLENPITPNQLQELLQQQRVYFLLDGLDEMQAASSVEALNKISQDINKLAAARVVLTCRLNVWDASTKNLLEFQNFKTQEFSSEQVRDFILAWFQRAKQEDKRTEGQGEQLWQKLNESGRERLLDLVKNPLRLALMCQVWDTTKDLPQTQAALYKRFTLYHYEWKQAEFPTTLAEQNELNAALGKLAREAIASGKTRFRIGQNFAYRVMGENLFNRACRLGWLNQVDRDKQTEEPFYAFYHATFQEYFAALAIDNWGFFLPREHKNKPVKDKDIGKPKPYRIFEPQWKEVILLWLGRENLEREKKEEFIKALVEFNDGCGHFYKYRAYFLAAAGIAEFRECSKADEVIAQIVKWGFGYFNTSKKQWETFPDPIEEAAKTALQQTHRTKIIAALVNLIDDNTSESELTRWLAADSLEKIDPGNETAINALLNLIVTSQDESAPRLAAHTLGKIAVGNETAITALLILIATSESELTRSLAADSLGKIAVGNETTIAALVNLIATSQDKGTRWLAAESLGKIDPGNETAIAALVNFIDTSQDQGTRWLATDSLGKIAVGNETAIAALVNLIATSQDQGTRWLAADSLGKIDPGNETAIAALVNFIATSQDEFTRWLAAESLGKIDPGNETAIAALVNFIDSSQDEHTRSRAVQSLRQIDPGNETAIAALVNFIGTSQDQGTRWLAAESLGKIDPGNETAIAALVNFIATSQDEFTRRQAAESLGQIDPGNETAIDALVNLIAHSQDKDTRRQAADSLGQIAVGNETAIDALVNLIAHSQDESTRRQVAYSLEKILPADQMAKVVIDLRDNSKPNEERYRVIWHCAQNMSYPAFYQAWHHQSYMKLTMRFAQYRWWQIALCLFLGLSIFALVRFIVSYSVNNPTHIQRQH
ncbi:MAG: HEAT repeat domain-containing protein [Scytonema hyalinum WJT4-NPBG1]|jgi:HEAT repeat protein/energy-coupling factor transporter ATP-binding protein EcfA2|nr:HEAT repeat domain-containing protein [Scytonema hyalinum WJT4-NPBG1]